ncbi:MAG: hypothetical protein U0166_11535 [Acidobacteriota bacterium]
MTGLALSMILAASAFPENVDPNNDGSQYAYQENQGWLNAEPLGNGGPGAQVGATGVTGYLWAENVGWISLSCANQGTCASVSYGVTNANGTLAGYAWGENVGWISFSCANSGTCATVTYGVTIDPSGVFVGRAWAENIGWLTFSASSPISYRVQTGWTPGGTIAADHLVGQGFGPPNANEIKVYTGSGGPTGVDVLAYAAGQWGVSVASGDVDGGPYSEILTGPGPGAAFGPQVRGFQRSGTSMGKINFYAYGTLKYGVNAGAGGVDGDAYAEILTGPGPGAVFGPHVRGWNFDGSAISAIAKISFFSYGTLKYGVNVTSGRVDADSYAEILTGPGPGAVFGPQVRGFDYDGSAISAIAKINFNAFVTPSYGVNVAGGDFDADAFQEIACTPGPGATSSFPSRFVGFDYDGAAIGAMPGFDVTAFPTYYGGRAGAGDVSADGREDLLAGAGRDSTADSRVKSYAYSGAALGQLPGSFTPFGSAVYGVNVAGGTLGY